MHRTPALAVALGTALCLAAAAQPAAAATKLQFFYPVGVAGPLAKVITGMVDEFNAAHPDIRVEAIYAGDYDPTMQKIQTAVMAGTPPDVCVVEISEIPTLVAMKALLPLDDFIAREGGERFLADFFPVFLKNGLVDGKQYGIPFQRSTPVLYWNKAAFKEAGLDPEKPPATWDELRDYARRLTRRDASGNPTRWGAIISGGWHDWLFEAFVRQNGGELIAADNRTAKFNSPEAVEALQFWVDLALVDRTIPKHSTWASTPPDFLAGQTAMLFHSTGIVATLRRSATFEFGTAFMPKRKQYGVAVGGGNLHIFRNIPRERQEAAWTFVKWMTEPERAAHWSINSGYIAVRKSAYELPTMREHVARTPQLLVARDQLGYAYPKMAGVNFQKIREVLKSRLDDAMEGRLDPKAALDQVQAEVSRILGR